MARGRKTSLTIHPHACGTPDAAGVAAGDDHLSGACQTRQDDLTRRRGVSITAIAAKVGISRRFVYKWVQRFLEQGVEGLADKPGRGARAAPGSPAGAARHWRSLGSLETARVASKAQK